MSKQTIILISGKAGMGKSHYAMGIQTWLRKDNAILSEIIPFAEPLKEESNSMSKYLFGKHLFSLNPNEKEIFRPILQAFGQVGRAIDKDFWIKKAIEEINYEGCDINIIDDCRFENELKAFDEEFNVIKIRINKPSANKNVNQDSSETGLDHIPDSEFDILITKEDSEQEVFGKVATLIEKFGE